MYLLLSEKDREDKKKNIEQTLLWSFPQKELNRVKTNYSKRQIR